MIQENESLLLYPTRGFSMFPFIWSGDYILVKKVSPETIRVDDIILFYSEPREVVCHRVVKIIQREGMACFCTKGRRVQGYDPLVTPDMILGRVVAIRRGGNTIELSERSAQLFLYNFFCIFAEFVFFVKIFLARFIRLRKKTRVPWPRP